MKPLTIEQLKSLEVDDWVWIIDKAINLSHYRKKIHHDTTHCLFERCVNDMALNIFRWEDYGKSWLAYKNKEQAESKATLVELPCKLGENFVIKDYGFNRLRVEQRRIVGYNFSQIENMIYPVDEYENSYSPDRVFSTKEQAERRLAELKGGKKNG